MTPMERATFADLTAVSIDMPPDEFEALMIEVAQWLPEDRGRMYRATVLGGERVKIESFDTISVAQQLDGVYVLGRAPKWVAERIAALSILSLPPPPQVVEEVGMRISANVFWIVAPKKD